MCAYLERTLKKSHSALRMYINLTLKQLTHFEKKVIYHKSGLKDTILFFLNRVKSEVFFFNEGLTFFQSALFLKVRCNTAVCKTCYNECII